MKEIDNLFGIPLLVSDEGHIYVRPILMKDLLLHHISHIFDRAQEFERDQTEEIVVSFRHKEPVRNRPQKTGGHVYLMRLNGKHKIGRTKNAVEDRRIALTRASGQEIEIVGSAYYYDTAYIAAERRHHDRYAEKRDIGEWFHLNDTEVAEILADFDLQREIGDQS